MIINPGSPIPQSLHLVADVFSAASEQVLLNCFTREQTSRVRRPDMPRPYAPEAKVTPFIGKAFLKMGVFGFPIADFKLKDTMRVAALGLHHLRDEDGDDDRDDVHDDDHDDGQSVGTAQKASLSKSKQVTRQPQILRCRVSANLASEPTACQLQAEHTQ